MSTRRLVWRTILALVAIALPLTLAIAHPEDPKSGGLGPAMPGSGHVGEPLLPDRAGLILDFPAKNVALLSWLTPEDLSGEVQRANDIWGYVSPSGREYAIIGLERGTGFVDITDPVRPKVLKVARGPESIWRDIAVYREHAYAVNETGGGVQVFDLTAIDDGKVKKLEPVQDLGLVTAHNISVNEESGFAYLSGPNLAGGGLVALDLEDPARPVVLEGTWPNHYVHDVLVVSYTKGRYKGREIAFAFAAERGVEIIDVTDKANMVSLSNVPYPNLAYCHSGWLSKNRKFLYVNDELDERETSEIASTQTYILRVDDLDAGRYVSTFSTGEESIDHNSMVDGRTLFAANYSSGLRVMSVKNPGRPKEIAYFDTHPEATSVGFDGAWGVYATFPSKRVIVSDIQRGLFVLDPMRVKDMVALQARRAPRDPRPPTEPPTAAPEGPATPPGVGTLPAARDERPGRRIER